MNKNRFLKMFIFSGICSIVFIFSVRFAINSYNFHKENDVLAKLLGVKINDYPYPNSFPIGYFDAVIKPGTDYKDVHKIVLGYDSVYHCTDDDFNYEVYNYFSDNKNHWTIFLISYDMHKKYDGHMKTSGTKDQTLSGLACVEGVLK